MTKREIIAAAFLGRVCAQANQIADEFDPKRQHNQGDHVAALDHVAKHASDGYFLLTGKHSASFREHEFNTFTPAEWVKTHKAGTFPEFDKINRKAVNS